MNVKTIPLDQLVVDPGLSMRVMANEGTIKELASSIKQVGIIQPLVVREKDDGKFIVVAGWRRLMAARMAGLVVVPCRVCEKGEDVDACQIHENLFREDVNDVDQGYCFIRLRDKRSLKLPEVAALVGKSLGYVMQRVQIIEADEKIKDALWDESISFSTARVLASIKDDALRGRLLALAIQQGAGPVTVLAWKKELEKLPAVEVEKFVSGEVEGEGKVPDILLEECYICRGKVRQDALVVAHICERCCKAIADSNVGVKNE